MEITRLEMFENGAVTLSGQTTNVADVATVKAAMSRLDMLNDVAIKVQRDIQRQGKAMVEFSIQGSLKQL